MSKKILVIGAGLVGSSIAIDLKKSGYEVTSVDLDPKVLSSLKAQYGIDIGTANLTDNKILAELVKDKDLVIGAAPGAIGYQIMEQVIHCGKNMVDISFCPENYLDLSELAKEKGVTVVADMGVAPGMCNTILGYHEQMMEVISYKCIVGGLPVRREWPMEYKSSWSPIDCIEEYVRPARFMQNGVMVEKPALSDAELVEFDEVGTLEEWNSDGLRSLLQTMPHIPNMVEKTLRYPGTIKYVKALRDLGFFSYDGIEVNGKLIRPIDLTSRLLFPKWKLDKGEKEFTIMRVTIEGRLDGIDKSYVYDLFDEYDPVTDTFSMARTTGYTCTAVANMIMNGRITERGVIAPEKIGSDKDNFEYLLHYLHERDVVYRLTEK